MRHLWKVIHNSNLKSVFLLEYSIIIIILLNMLAIVLESMSSFSDYLMWFYFFELFSISIFSIEYGFRVIACVNQEQYSHPVWGRLRYIISPMALIDLIAILPAYLTFVNVDLRVLRMLRIARIFRFMKLGRYTKAGQMLINVLSNKKEELIITICLIVILMLISATLIYTAEHEAQPEEFSSIPVACWWSIVTLTTVGYGDVYPVTLLGKTFAAFISILGIGMFALPAGILGAGFVDEIEASKKKDSLICPHCGKSIQ